MEKISHTYKSYMDRPMESKFLTDIKLKTEKMNLDSKFKELNGRRKLEIHSVCKHNSCYYVHYKVPTENPRKENTYDVILKFYSDSILTRDGNDIKKYNISFFSNSPGFVYQFAYVYKHSGLFAEDFIKKLPNKCFTQEPKVKNPNMIVDYDKTIYFAMKAFGSKFIHFNKGYLESKNKVSFHKMMRDIRTFEKINSELRSEDNKVKSENRMLDRQIKETNKLIDNKKKYAKSAIGSSAVKKKTTATTSTSKNSPVKPIKSAINKIAAKTRIKR